MLSKDQILKNHDEFVEILRSINIDGADVTGLIDYLESNDFFTAPASTQYHAAFEGGLCYHSLNVYHAILKLYNTFKEDINKEYSKDTLIIVGLLHDISKTNFYESFIANKKIYNEKGSKEDNQGKFDWFSEQAYKTKEAHDRFLGGTHGFNSMMIIGKFIPLTYEESVAIYNHHAGMDDKNATYDLTAIMNKYPLVNLIHLADMAAVYWKEAI